MRILVGCLIVLTASSCGIFGNQKHEIEPVTLEMWVNSYLGNCSEMELKEVFLVTQENAEIDPKAWECRHKKIEGFEFERGYFHQIKVEMNVVEGIPQYKYLETVQKLRDPNYYALHDIWVLTEVYDQPVTSSDITPTLEININSLIINGSGGCNTYRGSIVSYSDDKLKFGPVMSTKMACPDMELESKFLQGLSEVYKFERIKNELYLKNQFGANILKLKKVD